MRSLWARPNLMNRTLPLGSIASDLTPVQMLVLCVVLLSDVAPTVAARYKAKTLISAVETGITLTPAQTALVPRTTRAILRDLNRHVQPFCYCGHHPTSNQLGVWIDLDALHRAESAGQLTQVSGPDWRGVRSTYVLDIGGEGLTLYRRRGRVQLWHMA